MDIHNCPINSLESIDARDPLDQIHRDLSKGILIMRFNENDEIMMGGCLIFLLKRLLN